MLLQFFFNFLNLSERFCLQTKRFIVMSIALFVEFLPARKFMNKGKKEELVFCKEEN